MSFGPVLPRDFYARPTVAVARDLLGCRVANAGKSGILVEVEAYLGAGDEAAHAHRGLTERTKVLFGPPGHAYVYFVYGMHHCLNVVAEPEGTAGCVLLRGIQLDDGTIVSGPARLTRTLGVTLDHYGCDLTRGPITLHKREGRGFEIETTPRIGITRSVSLPLRFVLKR